jgi:hypothetical protein
MRLRTILAATVLTTLSAASVAQAEPQAGDRWSYSYRDDLTGEDKGVANFVVLQADGREIVVRHNVRGKDGPRTMYFTPQWARIDDNLWKFGPHDGLNIPNNPRVGRQWRIDHVAENLRTGMRLNVTGTARISGMDQITTAAGTFEAYRIDVADRRTNADSYAVAEGRTTIWYAPQVDRWVRRKFEIYVDGRLREATSDELIEVARASPSARPSAQHSTPSRPYAPATRAPQYDDEIETPRSHDVRRRGVQQTRTDLPGWDRRTGLMRD